MNVSDPNTLRDMGSTRNCEYKIFDDTDQAKSVKWKDLFTVKKQIQNFIDYQMSERSSTSIVQK